MRLWPPSQRAAPLAHGARHPVVPHRSRLGRGGKKGGASAWLLAAAGAQTLSLLSWFIAYPAIDTVEGTAGDITIYQMIFSVDRKTFKTMC